MEFNVHNVIAWIPRHPYCVYSHIGYLQWNAVLQPLTGIFFQALPEKTVCLKGEVDLDF